MSTSQISYCDKTLNPWTGCTPCSPGCDNCWAKCLLTTRLKHHFEGDPWKVTIHPVRFRQFEVKGKPKRIFVCSQSDFFHETIPFDAKAGRFIDMLNNDLHTWLILTKRIESAVAFFSEFRFKSYPVELIYPKQIWFGLTIVNQDEADKKIPLLKQIPVKNKFLSLEPLIGPVDLTKVLPSPLGEGSGVRWVIVGGESGPNARPMHPDWVRNIKKQCEAAGVAFYFKQWGQWRRGHTYMKKNIQLLNNGEYSDWDNDQEFIELTENFKEWRKMRPVIMSNVGKAKAGHTLDWKEYRQISEN